ncbi:glycophorin-C isoform X1 [Chroicocephalus ridibundus]
MFPGKMLYIWSMSRLWWLWRKNVNDGLVTLTYLHGKVRKFCSHMTINKAQLANCHMQHVLKKVRPSSRSTHFTHPFYDKKAAFPLQTSGSSIGAQQNPATVNEQQDHHRADLGGFSHPISQDKISTAPSHGDIESPTAGADVAVIGGVIAAVVFVLICLLVVMVRYMYRHKGTYHTNEAKGTEFAESADAALKNDPALQEAVDESKKEYFI